MPNEIPLEQGAHAEAVLTVEETDLASALGLAGEEQFPPVFATSRMVALMELAAARVLKPLLAEGELSVGVDISVRHTAATPAGARVLAEARFTGMEGKLFAFEIVAEDDAGEIGRATHRRAIISEERLLAGAAKRKS